MVAIAIGGLWLAYASGLYGYCLIRGYNVTPKQLLSFHWPPSTVGSAGNGGTNKTPSTPGTPNPGGGYRPPGSK